MLPAPAFAAVLADSLWCLGLGCLLGVLRGALGIAFGSGRVCGFWADMLTLAAAAVLVCGMAAGASAGGAVRWYMALAMACGAASLHRALRGAVRRAVCGVLWCVSLPFLALHRRVLAPLAAAVRAQNARFCAYRTAKKQKKTKKFSKTAKKQLQKPSNILYN